jgi:hypothetical protein
MASFGLVIKKHGVVNIVIFATLWSLWKLRNDLSFSECWLERDGYPAEQNCLYGAELANHVPGEQGFLPEYGGGTEDVSLEKLQVVDRMQSFLKMKQAGAGYFFRCFASLELLQTGVIESQCYRSCNAWVLSASGTFWLLPLRLVNLSVRPISHSKVFFSYNKSANSTFSHGLSAKRWSLID